MKSKKLASAGEFTILSDRAQAAAAMELYTLFIVKEGSPLLDELNQALHKLFDSLLRPQKLSEMAVGCPTDQAIFLASILSKNRIKSHDDSDYRTASYVAELCCSLCFGFRGIFSHIIRLLAAGHNIFIPYVPNPSLCKLAEPCYDSNQTSAISMEELLGAGFSDVEPLGMDNDLERNETEEEYEDFGSDIEGDEQQQQQQMQLNNEPSRDAIAQVGR